MERETTVSGLSDELIVSFLRQAEEDARDGRLVRCSNAMEVRSFFEELRTKPA